MAVNIAEGEIDQALDRFNGLHIDDGPELRVGSEGDGSFDDADADDDDDDDGDENDDDENEFLHSSTFLSNSQIIRTSNVNNLKREAQPNAMSSPTRRENTEEDKENRSHFKLFLPKDQSFNLANSDHSEHSEDLEGSDNDSQDDEPVKSSERSISRSSTRSKASRFIDIDNHASSPMLPKINPETTPWRKLRPKSEFLDRDVLLGQKISTPAEPVSTNFMKSIFDSNSTGSEFNKSPARSMSLFEPVSSSGENSSSTTASSSYQLENLRKQITNYKLQQRLLNEFIRNILKDSSKGQNFRTELLQRLEKENGILIDQRESLQNEMKNREDNEPPLPADSLNKVDDAKYEEKVKEVLELKNDLITTKNLNDELNSYLDELRAQINDQELSLNTQFANTKRWEKLVNEILTATVDFLNSDSAKAVVQARDESQSLYTKLKALSFALHEILQKYDQIATGLDSQSPKMQRTLPSQQHGPNGIPENVKKQIQQKREIAKQLEEDLRNLLIERADEYETIKVEYNLLFKKYTENSQFVGTLKKLLNEKRAKISELNDKIVNLESELEELSDQQKANSKEQETELLKNRLNVVKLTHSKEVENLKFEIEELKIEVERQKASSVNKSLEIELKRKQREISDLHIEIKHLNEELAARTRELESQDHLKQLLNRTQDNFNILQQDYKHLEQALRDTQSELDANDRDYKKKMDHAAKELSLAVAKQRTLASEKHKATFSLEESNKEKSRLAMNNNTLSEKVAKLSYQISSLNGYEIGFKSLFQLQLSTIEGFLIQFENVLEPSSLSQAQRKLQKLVDEELDFEQSYSITRSLFAYISNATSSLIDDYAVLARGDGNDTTEEVNQLKDEIDKLTEELKWCYDNGKFDDVEDSPRTKLRINELEKLRKAERESRKQEHHAFSTQIRTLVQENKELREKLKRLGK